MEETRNAHRMLFRDPKEKRPPQRPRHRWEDSIRLDLQETGYQGVDWIHLDQDIDQWKALVNKE
jgi:hypothetical protein